MLQDPATETLAKELAMAITQSTPDEPPPPRQTASGALWQIPECGINGSAYAPRLRPGAYLLEQALRELAA